MTIYVLTDIPRVKRINWKSVGAAFFATLTTLAALPYSLGDYATIIPPSLKPKVFIVGLVATVTLRFWNSLHPKPNP